MNNTHYIKERRVDVKKAISNTKTPVLAYPHFDNVSVPSYSWPMIWPNFGFSQWSPHWNQMPGATTTQFQMPHQQPYPVASSNIKPESRYAPYPEAATSGIKQESTAAALYPLQSLIQAAHQASPF